MGKRIYDQVMWQNLLTWLLIKMLPRRDDVALTWR
jgi:hypothetical protein